MPFLSVEPEVVLMCQWVMDRGVLRAVGTFLCRSIKPHVLDSSTTKTL